MVTVFLLLAVSAFVCTLGWAAGKISGWVPMILVCIIELLRALPLGH